MDARRPEGRRRNHRPKFPSPPLRHLPTSASFPLRPLWWCEIGGALAWLGKERCPFTSSVLTSGGHAISVSKLWSLIVIGFRRCGGLGPRGRGERRYSRR